MVIGLLLRTYMPSRKRIGFWRKKATKQELKYINEQLEKVNEEADG